VGDVVAEFHVLDALRREQRQCADGPSGLASAAEDRQPGGGFEATLKTYDALDVCAILGAQRRLDVTADLFERRRERFDIRFAQVCVLSYFCDSNVASHPNCGGLMHRVANAEHLQSGFLRDGACDRVATTYSVHQPWRRLHRGRLNVAIV
jgi:hypothetical protein